MEGPSKDPAEHRRLSSGHRRGLRPSAQAPFIGKHLGPDPRGCERGQLGKQGPRLGGDQAVYPGRKTQVPELSGKLNCKDYKGELLKKKQTNSFIEI